jgi:rSAM/selenodomain-associated transferase 2
MLRSGCSLGSRAITPGSARNRAIARSLLTPYRVAVSMTISIIVPCLNEAESIAGTLQALQPLRERGAEVLVVDGGSHADTGLRARVWADQILSAPRGRSRQMNAGAAAARGDILLFLHADCTLPEAADYLIVDGLNRSRNGWGRFDIRIGGNHPLLPVIANLMNARSRLTGIATGDQGIFVTRSLFEAAGRFPDIPLMEDVALSKQLKRFSAPLCLRHRITTSARRWERHGVLRTTFLMWRLRFAYWRGADPDQLALHYLAHGE